MSIRECIKEEYLVLDEKLEKILKEIKDDILIKIKKDDRLYDLICGYGVFEEMWFLATLRDDLTEMIEENPLTSKGLIWRIDAQKDEMIEEDYSIDGMYFYCLDSVKDYNECLDSCDNKFSFHEIYNVYVEDNKLIIEVK